MRTQPYALDPKFERAVVVMMCENPRFYGLVGHAVEPDALSDASLKLAAQAAQAIARDSGHGPSGSPIVVQRLRRWHDEGKIALEDVLNVVDALTTDEVYPRVDDLVDELAPILRRRAEAAAVEESMQVYAQHGDLSVIADKINRAKRIGVNDTSVGIRLGSESFKDIEKLRTYDRLITGVIELDSGIDGGLPRGQLGFYIGGPGDGKSSALISQAGVALRQKLTVAVATLELPEPVQVARCLSMLTRVPVNAILRGESTEVEKRFGLLQPNLGSLYVKEFTAHKTEAKDLESWLDQIEDLDGKPVDLLVVDYADKLSAPKETSEYQVMRVAYESLRILAAERKIWVWTASQATRKKAGTKVLDLDNVADSMHKVRIADLVVTLNVSEENDEIVYFVAKNRTGPSRSKAGPLPTQFAYGHLGPVVVPDSSLPDGGIEYRQEVNAQQVITALKNDVESGL